MVRKTSKKMRLFGAHMSIAGGFHEAIRRGSESGCDVIQLFTRNNMQWKAPPIPDEEVEKLREAERSFGIRALFAHASYLINIASPDVELFSKSVASLTEEIERAERLGIPFLVLHCGSHMGSGAEAGMKRTARAIRESFDRSGTDRVSLLLETTAGQGDSVGSCFAELGKIISLLGGLEIGVCLDTCHIFAAGYDFRTGEKYGKMIGEFEREIGINRIGLIHANDSLKGPGSRVDRHDHIGKGMIGWEGFRLLLKDRRLKEVPVVIETRKGVDGSGRDLDTVNLGVLRRLAR